MAKSKKPLTKRQRSLVTAGAILAALILVVGVLFVLPSAEQPEESESSSEKEEGIRIFGFDSKMLETIEVENAFCEYTIDITTGTYDSGEEYTAGTIRELENVVNVDTTSIGQLVYYGVDLFARQIITDDLSRKAEFGLDDPEIVLTYNFSDGTSDQLYLGAVDASAIGRYVLYNDTIYLAYDAAIGLYAKDFKEYVSAGISPERTDEETDVSYKYFNFSGTKYTNDIIITYNEESFNQNEYVLNTSAYDLVYGDVKKTASMDAVEQRFINIFNRTAKEIVEVDPDDATVAKYGLDEPYVRIDYAVYTDDTHTEAIEYFIKITEPVDGVCYAMNQTEDVIFLMEIAGNDVFTMGYNDVVNKMSLVPFITKVEEISYKTPDGEYVFTLEHFTNDEDEADIIVECDGQRMITDYFRTLYTSTIGITANEYLDVDEIPSTSTLGDPAIEITIKYINGGRDDDTITMYKGPALRYYVAYNGQVEFLTQNTKVDLMLNNITKVLNNEEPEF